MQLTTPGRTYVMDAIQIVNDFGGRDICNRDVKTRNFIVRRDPGSGRFKVLQALSGWCDWGSLKAFEDEEGAVGLVMGTNFKGGFEYRRTPQSKKWQDEFMREELSKEESSESSEESSEKSHEWTANRCW